MTQKFTTDFEEIVSHNFSTIDPDESVEVNLRDLLYVYQSLNECVRFFQQANQAGNMGDIHRFLGKEKERRGFCILQKCLDDKLAKMLPEHIDQMLKEGVFTSPKLPFYLKEEN